MPLRLKKLHFRCLPHRSTPDMGWVDEENIHWGTWSPKRVQRPTDERHFYVIFRVSLCRKGTIHLQTSILFPGFKPSSNGTAVSERQ
ncbi:hypothetical protein TNCV_4857231 [Trichonephila clavipes]|uniref:Uncharacterized protein n=1 Tax=Trichonephila clavipes TaxID=2585209 RepID=A0A8X6RF87_TRICX|nr:hypothetical protein TNCV_4857231 [Trichonephila clavipes]